MTTTTLAAIRAARPCVRGWIKLRKHLGKTEADDEPLPLLTVLDGNGYDDALWVLSCAMPESQRLARHFQAWCAEQVLHNFEALRPGDDRVRAKIKMLRNDSARDEQRAAARAAAWDASGDATAVVAATWDDAWAAARAAARAAAVDSARAAAQAAAVAAAWAAAGSEAWAAAWDAQEAQLRKMLTEGF